VKFHSSTVAKGGEPAVPGVVVGEDDGTRLDDYRSLSPAKAELDTLCNQRDLLPESWTADGWKIRNCSPGYHAASHRSAAIPR
jgi:hypothetical protein